METHYLLKVNDGNDKRTKIPDNINKMMQNLWMVNQPMIWHLWITLFGWKV